MPQVNENFTVLIKIDNVVNLSGYEIHLSFNKDVLQVVQMSNGDFLEDDVVAQNGSSNDAGTIDYAIAQLNRNPVTGSGTLLNITFKAKAAGTSTVALRPTAAAATGLLLSDQNGASITATWTLGSVTVLGVPTITSTSTPATSTLTPSPTPTITLTNTVGPSITPTFTVHPSITATYTPTGPTATPSFTSTAPTNTPTFTPTVTPTSTSTVVTTSVVYGGTLGTHEVRLGEWLFCIGRAYGVSPWAIAEKNNIWWPYFIFPFQTLTIPNIPWNDASSGRVCTSQFTVSTTPVVTATPTATSIVGTYTPVTSTTTITSTPTATVTPIYTYTPTVTPVPSSGCTSTYVVVQGDNLFRIAYNHGTTYSELARVNNISDPTKIYVGQQLCIP
jgi:LysM repeat protein